MAKVCSIINTPLTLLESISIPVYVLSVTVVYEKHVGIFNWQVLMSSWIVLGKTIFDETLTA